MSDSQSKDCVCQGCTFLFIFCSDIILYIIFIVDPQEKVKWKVCINDDQEIAFQESSLQPKVGIILKYFEEFLPTLASTGTPSL